MRLEVGCSENSAMHECIRVCLFVIAGDLDADVYYGHEDDIHGMRTVEKEDEGDVFDRCCNHRTILLGAILVACAWLLYTHAPYIMQQVKCFASSWIPVCCLPAGM